MGAGDEATSLRTGFLLSVETLVHESEGRSLGISDSGYRDDIDAVEVIGIPWPKDTAVGSIVASGLT